MVEIERLHDRAEAGRRLAERLRDYAGRHDVAVLALPRGGVAVGYEVARELGAPLDVMVVRKLGMPGHEEFAMGAIAGGGVLVLDPSLIRRLGLSEEQLRWVVEAELHELERREASYRGDRGPLDLTGKTVILVDDGLATGSTMRAAAAAVRRYNPERVVVAVPVASPETCDDLRGEVDEVVCMLTPRPFEAVGQWYEDFAQLSDDEVRDLLARAKIEPRREKFGPLAEAVGPLTGMAGDYDPLLEGAARAKFVLLGEGSHGTHEFYRERAEITKRLIAELGVTAVTAEADWPDAYRVNLYVRGQSDDESAEEALSDFRRFPAWMWRNADVVEFVAWLREWNGGLPEDEPRVGFYGLDLYSLLASMEAVIAYLEEIDPASAQRARERYACFDQYGPDPQVYAYETAFGGAEPCEQQVVEQLANMRRQTAAHAGRDGRVADDRRFYAEQNARLVVNAEQYYRAVFSGGADGWNLRDLHMAETLEELVAHLERTQGPTRVAVWAHNSHVGDARATRSGQGKLNVGQLVRERHANAFLVGFTTYTGTVTAASGWGAPAERKRVRLALPGSWERLFHDAGTSAFLLTPVDLEGQRLERAIGVVYSPQTERLSHYFEARISEQFDAVVHFDETRAVEPLERTSVWEEGELPETYPWAV